MKRSLMVFGMVLTLFASQAQGFWVVGLGGSHQAITSGGLEKVAYEPMSTRFGNVVKPRSRGSSRRG